MHKQIRNLSEYSELMTEVLAGGGEIYFAPRGVSMYPTIREGQDKVILSAVQGKLRKGDVPLYRRDNGDMVLHRVYAVTPTGYTMRGDNQNWLEHGIREEQIVAILTAVERPNGKVIACNSLRWRWITWKLPLQRILRHYYYALRAKLGLLKRKIIKK